jgi:hypothetical protein
MSTHCALSMGNNLTASCEDMQDNFQPTFVPWRRGCWCRESPCTRFITATLQTHVENDLGFCSMIHLCSRFSLTSVIFISENTSHSYYNLSVPTNAHIILIYISPVPVPTGFGWSPSSGSPQPSNLKLTAINESLQCCACECTNYVKIYNTQKLKFTIYKVW